MKRYRSSTSNGRAAKNGDRFANGGKSGAFKQSRGCTQFSGKARFAL